MDLKAMLHRGDKIIIFFALIIFIIMINSCNRLISYNEKEIAAIRERTMLTSQEILGKETYFEILQMANDSIANWIKNELRGWSALGSRIDFQLDSVFCVNKTGDKIFFTILRRNLHKESTGDGIF
jgi:hypothetical protein